MEDTQIMATLLIVDDRPDNREYLVTLLGYGGHRLLQAADGAEALAVARSKRPDLVLADILMPTMDGYEFVHQLRADPDLAATPVIFCTAHYLEREAQTLAEACGVAHILTKPMEPEVVLRTVDAVLCRTPTAAVPPRPEQFDREHLLLLTDKLSQKADELKRTNERLAALIDFGLEIGSQRDPRQMFENVCHQARKIIGARYAIAGILNGVGPPLRYFFLSGMDAVMARRLVAPDPKQDHVAGVLAEVRCRRVNNPGGDPTALGFPSTYPPIHSWLGAPIVSPGRVYGWLGLIDKVGDAAFSEEDERLAGILTAQVGRIYESSTLYTDAMHRAAELEREIGERRRAEASVKEREERIRLFLDSSAEGFYGVDLNGICNFANRACARLLGFDDTKQMLGKDLHPLIHHTRPDGSPYPKEECRIYQAFRRDEETHVADEVFWRTDGSSFPVEYWSYPIRRAGQTIGAVVSFWDITERKQLEDRFRQAQLRLQEVVASSPAVLFTMAVEGEALRPTWTSANLTEMMGYPVEQVTSAWWLKNLHPEDREGVLRQIDQDLFSRNRVVSEYRFQHLDGKYRWVRAELRLLRDPAGNPHEVVGSWSDITERKQLEDQYRQAQKMEAIGRLAGGVAHDFNNLLTVINGYGELLMSKLPAGDPARQLIQEVITAGNRAAGLTRQLLAFSRKAIIEPKLLNLQIVVSDLEKMLRRILGEDVRLATRFDPVLGTVKADVGQIEQVLVNLAVNARDAMPQGGELTIEVRNADLDESYTRDHAEARSGPYVLLAVSDTGCGMDEATMSHIFEPFFTTKGELGTGLGLATVHGIIKQSGGHVAVYSEVGHGTTFKVYLPRIEQQAATAKSHAGLAVLPHGTETLLLVEDEDGVRALSQHVLKSCGYTVLVARDGIEALRVAREHPGRIDLLVSDVVLPRIGGRELSKQIKEIHPEAKVLYVSGYTDDVVVRHGILEARVAFLQKPFGPAGLASKVREVLDSK
jgi:PAS domain S-box-containing protein